jgi:hypothetical protein
MHRANAGYDKLHRAKRRRELDQLLRPEAGVAPDAEHDLRTPHVFKAVSR